MTAMEVLERCRQAESDLRRLMLRIQQRREAAACVSPKVDEIGGGHSSGPKDKLAENVADIDRLSRKYDTRQEQYAAEVAAACVLLDSLPETISNVLHRYYVKREKISATAAELGYTEGYIRRMKCEGEERLMAVPESEVAAAFPAWYLRSRSNEGADVRGE